MTEPPESSPDRPVPLVDQAPALTRVAWSSEIVGQTLEALLVALRGDQAWFLHPIHAPALRVGWHPEHQPGDVVVEAAQRYGLVPLLVHSTSWRFEGARVILTYVAAVEPPRDLNQHLAEDPVARAELARGDALGPPIDIDLPQVLEHAFRHLAVRAALPSWAGFLSAYEPEPFRSFGGPPPG
jgi:hypothetical protein